MPRVIISLFLVAMVGCNQSSVSTGDHSRYASIQLPPKTLALSVDQQAYVDSIDDPEEQAFMRDRLRFKRRGEMIRTIRERDGGSISTPPSAFVVLATATQVSGTAVGYAGTMSPEVEAWRVLLAQPDASDAFRRLFERGTLVGQFYALCGLHLIDRPEYNRLAPAYFQQDDGVSGMIYGCCSDWYMLPVLEPCVTDGSLPAYFRSGEYTEEMDRKLHSEAAAVKP